MSDDLHRATQRLVRTVDAITDEEYAAPSGLPDWSRAHVVAHLTLNAEGLAAALAGVAAGVAVPMYASAEQRDADIDALARRSPAGLRDLLLSSSTALSAALAAVQGERLSGVIERTPGSDRRFPAHAVASMRLREVEIHHADLDLAYRHHHWSPEFCAALLEGMSQRFDGPQPFTADPTDLDGTWQCGVGPGPVVTGSAADLGWWLTGRGQGEGLTSDDGTLPMMEDW